MIVMVYGQKWLPPNISAGRVKGIGTYPQYVPQKFISKDRNLISIAWPIGSWIFQVQSIPFW